MDVDPLYNFPFDFEMVERTVGVGRAVKSL